MVELGERLVGQDKEVRLEKEVMQARQYREPHTGNGSEGGSKESRHITPLRRMRRERRCARIIMTDEARCLKCIREERQAKKGVKNFSIRAVAKKMNRTDSWLAHIENGRADIPQDERLDELLKIYGLKKRSFYERVRIYKQKRTPQIEMQELLPRLNEDTLRVLLKFTYTLIN